MNNAAKDYSISWLYDSVLYAFPIWKCWNLSEFKCCGTWLITGWVIPRNTSCYTTWQVRGAFMTPTLARFHPSEFKCRWNWLITGWVIPGNTPCCTAWKVRRAFMAPTLAGFHPSEFKCCWTGSITGWVIPGNTPCYKAWQLRRAFMTPILDDPNLTQGFLSRKFNVPPYQNKLMQKSSNEQ